MRKDDLTQAILRLYDLLLAVTYCDLAPLAQRYRDLARSWLAPRYRGHSRFALRYRGRAQLVTKCHCLTWF